LLGQREIPLRYLGLEEAFAKFKAKLENRMWAVCAFAPDGSLVISCWSHRFGGGGKGVMRYTDTLSRWGSNKPGSNLLREHLSVAHAQQLPVRLVVATYAEGTKDIESITDASKVEKTFHVREDVEGKVVEFDGDTFIVDFRKSSN
jgi:hypothetical protein